MRQQKPVYSPFVQKYRRQAYRLSDHKSKTAPARGVLFALLIVSPFWLLVAYLATR